MPLPAVAAPWLLALVGLGPIVVPLVRRVLIGLGFGLVTYVGIGELIDQVKTGVETGIGGAAADIQTILVMARVDDAIQIVFSAIAARLLYAGFNAVAGSITRPRWNFND